MARGFKRMLKPLVERFPSVAMGYRQWRDSRQIAEPPQPTPLGFRFSGNRAMQEGRFEPVETKLFDRLIEDVQTVVNIGANTGYYVCIARHAGKQVIAFEPIRRNVRYLCQNVQANGWTDDIEVFPIALSNRTGVVEIYGGGTGASLIKGWNRTPAHWCEFVPTTTLDNVVAHRLAGRRSLFLVDIEGAERIMLKGASQCLRLDPQPVWMIEIQIAEHQPEGVALNPNLLSTFELFWEAGYLSWTADREVRAVERAEVQRIAETGEDTIGTHNFIFAGDRFSAGELRLA